MISDENIITSIEYSWHPLNIHNPARFQDYYDHMDIESEKKIKSLVSEYDITEREAVAVQKFIADLKRNRAKQEQSDEQPKEVKKTLRRPVALY